MNPPGQSHREGKEHVGQRASMGSVSRSTEKGSEQLAV